MDNLDKGITYILLNLQYTKLFVFVNSSFANNKDFSSQIRYLIILANKIFTEFNKFILSGNLIYYSSTKSKRVTRSVLALEIYGIVRGVNMAIAVNTTIHIITEQLDLPKTSIVVCTNLYLLYKCLVKLGTTKEKRLIINIIVLQQLYERRQVNKI